MDENISKVIVFIAMGLLLPLLIALHLLPALFSLLLTYELVHIMANRLPFCYKNQGRAKIISLALLFSIVLASLSALMVTMILFLQSDAGSIPKLLEKLADIIERTREAMPTAIQAWLPIEPSDLQNQLINQLRSQAAQLQRTTGHLAHGIMTSFIGMVIGGLIAVEEVAVAPQRRFIGAATVESSIRLSNAFRTVVFAQIQISAINTFFTAVYLVIILPLFGVFLPLIKTLILLTFIVGLLPVIGNLVSNSVIVIISLSYSMPVAISSLCFLVAIHKVEYFINARIVGAKIKASTWELLAAMLFMEALFGLQGVVAAPVYYAYFKEELQVRGLI